MGEVISVLTSIFVYVIIGPLTYALIFFPALNTLIVNVLKIEI